MNPFSKGEYVNIIVRNARTHIEEGRAKFTDYEIELKTNHISFSVKQSKVRRRYSDFVWLRERLAKDLMTSDPPSLPGRRLFGRFNTDFIKQRQRKLQDFLSKVVKNNVFLSHAALHLFLQTKMSIEEIEEEIDSKNDEDPSDRILSESAFKEPIEARNRLPSKQDSGIESSGHDDGDIGDLSTVVANANDEEEKFADGNTADSEDNAENDASDNNNTDDDQLEGNFRRKLCLSSLPSVTSKDETNDLESSVEFLINGTDDSQEEESEEDVIDEDKEVESVSKKSPAKKFSVGPNNRPRRRRSRRRRRTCIAQFNLSEHSNAKEEEKESSLGAFQEQTFLRRCFSFDMFSRSFSMFDMKKQASSSKNIDCDTQSAKTSRNSLCRSSSSRLSELEDRYKLRYSGSEEKFRSPVKRKISLKEYHIVKREACFHVSMDENEFNSSF